jgi:hypothetical protein
MRKTALLLSLVTASLFGAEVRVDQPVAPVQFGAAPSRMDSARVASDGTNFFAVWRRYTGKSDAVVIGGGRLSPSGQLLDQPSILLASGVATKVGFPDVVFVGGNFLVVYQSGTSVFTRRFSRDGRPVDTQPVTISNSRMVSWLATNGKTVLLPTAWNRIRMLAADGTPFGPELAVPNADSGSLSVASNGDRYLIASPSIVDSFPHGAIVLLSGTGQLLVTKPIPLADTRFLYNVTTASDGSSFLLHMVTGELVGCMRVDANGNTGPLQTLDNQSARSITATWSGGAYTLAWSRKSTHEIVGARVDAGGALIDSTPVTIAPARRNFGAAFASAWNGRDTIIVTSEDTSTGGRMTAAIFTSLPQIDAEPAARRRAAIASSAAEQTNGSIASNGTLSLVAWREMSGLDQMIVRAAFIAADGQLGAPFDLGEADPASATASASDGRDFLVTYIDSRDRLVGRRVTIEGVLDSTPLIITPNVDATDQIAIGWSGHVYVVMTAGAVTISAVTAEGNVTLSSQRVPTWDPADSPAVQCTATGCIATWHTLTPFYGFGEVPVDEYTFLAFTDLMGTVLSSVVTTTRSGVTPGRTIPFADGRSLFVYSDGKVMFAKRVTADGVVIDSPDLNPGISIMTSNTSFPLQPVAVVRGGLYLVEPDNDTAGRLYWSRIETDPSPRVTSLINLHQTIEFPLALTASSRNTYFLISGGADDPQLMASRLFVRTIPSPDPLPARKRAVR